jgi:predicted RNA methylase
MNNNINDTELYENLLNRYIEYYKKAYPENNIKNMFDKINYDDQTSTNHIMEMFYYEMHKYNKLDNEVYVSLNDIQLEQNEKINELFGLQINNDEIVCVSYCIISLLIEIINNDYKIWNIINIL